MRILFISTLSHTPWGGSEVLWVNTAKKAKNEGHDIAALVYKWHSQPEHYTDLSSLGIQLIYRPSSLNKTSLITRIINKIKPGKSFRNLSKQIDTFKPEVIIINQGHSYDIGYNEHSALIEKIRKEKIPFHIICHNNTDYSYVPEDEIRKKVKSVYKRAKRVLFVSERNRHMAELNLQQHLNNSQVISNSLSLGNGQDALLPYPNGTDTTHFSIVANLKCSHKGQNLIFDILSDDAWRNKNWILNLYGTGENEKYLKDLAKFLGISQKVIFHGHVKDIKKVWETNHILLLASFGEGMPLALQEAMLCGRPAIVTDVGGNSELIVEGHTGFLSEGTTKGAFNRAMEKAWDQKDNWKNIGLNAHQFALDKIDLTPEKTLLNIIKNS